MSNLSEWWNALDTIHKIYWGLAIPFTLIFLIQMVLTFIGGEIEVDGDADFDVESDSGAGFQFFTLKNFIGFFTIFSWSGIAGLLMMTLMASLFYFFSKLTDSGTLNINNAKGAVAEVYMRIHGSRGNIGKVLVKVQGSLRELEAITDDPEDLPTGAVVNVKEVINDNILLVSKH